LKPLGLVLLFALATAAPEPRYFQYQRPIQNVPQVPTQTCLALDAGIFSHAAPMLADLRLYRNQAETPWVLRTAQPVAAMQQSIHPLNLGKRNGQTVFDAAIPEGNFSDVELFIAAENFLATAQVSGSNQPSDEAATKLGSYTLFDLSSQKLGRSTVLHLPESNFRFLHFRITGPLQPENITGISVERVSATLPRYLTVAQSSSARQKGHTTEIEFTLPANTPVDRIAFVPGAEPAVFSREVSVSSVATAPSPGTSDETEQSHPFNVTASGNLLRVHRVQNGHRIDEERLTIDTSVSASHPAEKWTIRIDNGDDPPVSLQSVRLEMLERDLCFESASPANFTLMYGDPALAAPQYDYQKLFEFQPNAAQAIAGPEQRNPEYQPRPDSRPFTEKHPALLWAVLVAVIALLGGIAFRTARRTGTTWPTAP
jgi:uncharacterized protein DUF3999